MYMIHQNIIDCTEADTVIFSIQLFDFYPSAVFTAGGKHLIVN